MSSVTDNTFSMGNAGQNAGIDEKLPKFTSKQMGVVQDVVAGTILRWWRKENLMDTVAIAKDAGVSIVYNYTIKDKVSLGMDNKELEQLVIGVPVKAGLELAFDKFALKKADLKKLEAKDFFKYLAKHGITSLIVFAQRKVFESLKKSGYGAGLFNN